MTDAFDSQEWRDRLVRARDERRLFSIEWFWNLAVARGDAPSDEWVDWYRSSLEAGQPLPLPA